MSFEGLWDWFVRTIGYNGTKRLDTIYPPSDECTLLHRGSVWSHVIHRETGREYARLEMDFPLGEGVYGSNVGDLWNWNEHMRVKVYESEHHAEAAVESEEKVALYRELNTLRKQVEEHRTAMDAVYKERALCNQLIVAMSKGLGAVGGVRAASLKEDREWPVVFARIPMIDPQTKRNYGEHEVSWHVKRDNMMAEPEDFGIVDLPWDGQDNNVTYDRVKQLTQFFLHIANKADGDGDDDGGDYKNKPE